MRNDISYRFVLFLSENQVDKSDSRFFTWPNLKEELSVFGEIGEMDSAQYIGCSKKRENPGSRGWLV
ncbi:MAG TPA: hypothetical protein PKY88_12265 [Anaerohalosphaeraceae bacterium]|nr:hypothetical protein [Anaerohalosphaeraceae bacterium]